jgi:hypothetical protein
MGVAPDSRLARLGLVVAVLFILAVVTAPLWW